MAIAFCNHLETEFGEDPYVPPADLLERCDEAGIERYTYDHHELSFEPQY
ncbi:hypothetical protein [Natrinema sp. 74]